MENIELTDLSKAKESLRAWISENSETAPAEKLELAATTLQRLETISAEAAEVLGLIGRNFASPSTVSDLAIPAKSDVELKFFVRMNEDSAVEPRLQFKAIINDAEIN